MRLLIPIFFKLLSLSLSLLFVSFSLLEALHYNELYDLYHDDYPALRRTEDTPLHKVDVYKQYQSFIDVAAVEGKLVISTSWHPNYTGNYLSIKAFVLIYHFILIIFSKFFI